MPKAYSYIRMSTEAQLKGDSLRRQLELSRKYAAAKALDLDETFSPPDIGISAYKGANVSGGSLGKFLAAVESGEIEKGSYLLVESLDRLSRQEVLKSLALFLQIINSGIVLVTLADERVFGLDSVNEGDLFISIGVMSRAHDESRMKSNRLSQAWENKRRNAANRKLTAMAPGWLELAKDKTSFNVIQERKDLVCRIFLEAASGIGIFSIARRLNVERMKPFGRSNGWHGSSVSKILGNRAVIGQFQPHRRVNGFRTPIGAPIKDYFPAIVPEDLFYAAQAGLEQRRFSGAGRKGESISNLFGKLATCAYCGSRMRFENKGRGPKGGTYLICEAGFRKHNCKAIRWKYNSFETSFLAFVQELDLKGLLGAEDQATQRNDLAKKRDAASGRLAELKRQRENIFALTARADFDTNYVGSKLKDCELEIDKVSCELKQHEEALLVLSEQSLAYYESQVQMTELIAKVRNREGQDVYRHRASIAFRLKTIVSALRVSAAGYEPIGENIAAALEKEDLDRESRELFEELLEYHSMPESRLPHFEVEFRDGSTRIVFPDPDDPLKFRQQVEGKSDSLESLDPTGERTPIA